MTHMERRQKKDVIILSCRSNPAGRRTEPISMTMLEYWGKDKLLVLSVCISGQDEQRYLVISRLKERVAL